MFLPQNIKFLLNLDTILAGKLILEQALPAFATAWLRHCAVELPGAHARHYGDVQLYPKVVILLSPLFRYIEVFKAKRKEWRTGEFTGGKSNRRGDRPGPYDRGEKRARSSHDSYAS